MGILPSPESAPKTPVNRRSTQIDFGSLKPLNTASGIKNFAGYRDESSRKKFPGAKTDDDMDSDVDDDDEKKMADADDVEKEDKTRLLSPEDAEGAGEAAEGIRKMKVSY